MVNRPPPLPSRPGSDVYRSLSDELADAEARVGSLGDALRDVRGQIEEARREEVRTVARLARARLGALDAEQVAGPLDDADRQALELLALRDRQRTELRAELDRSAAALAALDAERDAARDAHTASETARDAAIRATLDRLAAAPDYVALRGHVEFLTGRAGQATDKAARAEQDRDRKRAPYERDKLFSYLWRRRYGTPDYRAWTPIRALDTWVARLCRFRPARDDYALLLEIPKRLRQHAEELARDAKAATAELATAERAALEADGIGRLDAAVEAANRAFRAATAAFEQAERRHGELHARLTGLDEGSDELGRRALWVLETQLAREDVETLRRDAAATAPADDDRIVVELAHFRDRQRELATRLAELQTQHREAAGAAAELRELQQRFRQRGFDRNDSVFGPGLDLGGVLAGIVSGALQAGAAFGLMRRFQRSLLPRSELGSGAAIAGRMLDALLSAASHSH